MSRKHLSITDITLDKFKESRELAKFPDDQLLEKFILSYPPK